MAAAEEEEVRLEVEAVTAMYGDDCRVVLDFPPHLVVHVRPNTADDSSQQFVELFLGIKASSQYPKEPPDVYAVESKGLDETRQRYLISSIQNKAKELSYYPMLVTLCEEAGEILSNMNHPAGDCPLCLYPLVPEDKDDSALPFMKLMSCYHCFHSNCIMRWWGWLQQDDVTSKQTSTAVTTGVIDSSGGLDLSRSGKIYNINHHKGFCPVCRKVFDEKDIKHFHDLLDANISQLMGSLTIDLGEDDKELLYSEAENKRREKFGSLFNLQQERNGLIEPKKDLAIQPGMYVSLPLNQPQLKQTAPIPAKETRLQLQKQIQAAWETTPAGISKTIQATEGETELTLPKDNLRANLLGSSGREANLLVNNGRGKKQAIHNNSIIPTWMWRIEARFCHQHTSISIIIVTPQKNLTASLCS